MISKLAKHSDICIYYFPLGLSSCHKGIFIHPVVAQKNAKRNPSQAKVKTSRKGIINSNPFKRRNEEVAHFKI